ncbi:peptidylprolyl isomerase [Myxococcota bacterium]|nr:peptidylprolyl isomerase [Myxococcota bacterium]
MTDRRATVLLAIGAAAGLAMAASSLISTSPDLSILPDQTVARVNGVSIRRDDYRRAVAALASDRRSAMTPEDHRHVLDRLVDEELMVQYALALGLAESDRRVRGDLVSAVMGSLVASTDDFSPTESQVRRFYRDHADYFTRPGRIRLRQIFVGSGSRRSDSEAMDIARRATERLDAGESFSVVKRELGDREIAPIPDAPLPPSKLRNYLGPTVLRAALPLQAGTHSAPVRSAQGVHVVQITEKAAPSLPALAQIEGEVRAEMKRREGDRAVRQTLDNLRATGQVTISEQLP